MLSHGSASVASHLVPDSGQLHSRTQIPELHSDRYPGPPPPPIARLRTVTSPRMNGAPLRQLSTKHRAQGEHSIASRAANPSALSFRREAGRPRADPSGSTRPVRPVQPRSEERGTGADSTRPPNPGTPSMPHRAARVSPKLAAPSRPRRGPAAGYTALPRTRLWSDRPGSRCAGRRSERRMSQHPERAGLERDTRTRSR